MRASLEGRWGGRRRTRRGAALNVAASQACEELGMHPAVAVMDVGGVGGVVAVGGLSTVLWWDRGMKQAEGGRLR